MVQNRAIVTMALTNSHTWYVILNDLDGPQTQISRSGHSLTLNISKTAADTAIVTMYDLSNGSVSSDLE